MNPRFLTKAVIPLFCFLCLNICLCANAKEAAAFEKDGQIYLIQSAKDMQTLAQLVNRNEEVEPGVKAGIASYRLTRDIDISQYCTGEEGWEPIGYRDNRDDSFEGILWEKVEESGEGEEHWTTYEATDAGYFNGTFDGDGHVVTGLYINRPEEGGQGLFGQRMDLRGKDPDSAEYKIRETTIIKNLYVKDCDITGGYNTGGVMGGMWNYIQNEGGNIFIENCHVTGKIIAEGCAGGVVGSASTVKNCSFTGTVEGYNAGGIAGEAYYIYGSAVHADVAGFYAVGGISGESCCVRNSYMIGSVAGYDRVGGIVGEGSCLTGCYTRADVKGYSRTGGLIGDIQSRNAPRPEGSSNAATIQNCLMGGYRMDREAERDTEVYYPTNDRYNGYIYGFPGAGIDDRVTSAFYYRKGLVTEGFGKGMYEFSEWNCKPYDCEHLEETDFKDLIKRPEEKWSDVWWCADNYVWPNLVWEKESRFGYQVTVTVQEGDSLWEIANKIYDDGNLWELIYEQNKDLIGDDENLIIPGMDIEIVVYE